ncbi:MAG: SUMF1/EgtB/PvdO family nonheme iron enzyme, partial [Prevotella sp.]|nr:SUMF1/EgtB/PvdO family nonheme iron enzyme [Prevotella sp.]
MRKQFLVIFTLLSAGICRTQTLPDALFTHITSDGTYTMLADKDNHIGSGEQVAISKEFYMARHAVSNTQWQQFITATGRQTPNYWSGGAIPEGKEQHPVVWVSADEAQAYCQWLGTHYPDYA